MPQRRLPQRQRNMHGPRGCPHWPVQHESAGEAGVHENPVEHCSPIASRGACPGLLIGLQISMQVDNQVECSASLWPVAPVVAGC